MTPIETALVFTGLHEWSNKPDGQYTDDPVDPGGETKFGISKRAHPDVDIKNLTLAQATDIYQKEYWDPAGCSRLELPLAVCVFDTAVNCGVHRALEFLDTTQDVLGYTALRRNYYNWLVTKKPSDQKYIKGWLNRINDLRKYVDTLTTQK